MHASASYVEPSATWTLISFSCLCGRILSRRATASEVKLPDAPVSTSTSTSCWPIQAQKTRRVGPEVSIAANTFGSNHSPQRPAVRGVHPRVWSDRCQLGHVLLNLLELSFGVVVREVASACFSDEPLVPKGACDVVHRFWVVRPGCWSYGGEAIASLRVQALDFCHRLPQALFGLGEVCRAEATPAWMPAAQAAPAAAQARSG
ncbi:hypothetical protein CYMTET_51436 [Cymbomonas tetramitiformis]|uniref:Uncharacterized protein n=1 Tax=Cymbomonas tetramitiformis TaxID=36881 RepID=A0AAE0ES49_9CHLO|nr:hypothetical protein CYMTET_51436 [Cymbomonas tetramitiformis]